MELSVIIPLYNTEKYIEKCVLSAVNQDIDASRYEILVINDGSTDNGAQIVADIAAQHQNIKLLNKPNGGLSDARNYGIDRACGDYILFLDSDDYFAPEIFPEIIKQIETYAHDMLAFDYTAVDTNGAVVRLGYESNQGNNPTAAVSGKEFLFCHPALTLIPMVGCYCFKRQFLNDNSLRFIKIVHEDEEFTPRAIALSKSIKYIPKTIYYYLRHEESMTVKYNPQNIFNIVDVAKSLKNFVNTVIGDDKELRDYFMQQVANLIIATIWRSIESNFGLEKQLIKYAKQQGVIPIYNKMNSSKRFMLNYFPALYIMRCKRLINR